MAAAGDRRKASRPDPGCSTGTSHRDTRLPSADPDKPLPAVSLQSTPPTIDYSQQGRPAPGRFRTERPLERSRTAAAARRRPDAACRTHASDAPPLRRWTQVAYQASRLDACFAAASRNEVRSVLVKLGGSSPDGRGA